MSFGNRLKEARKRSGMTQGKLAEKTELATGTIQMYERNKRKPTPKTLKKLAKALGVSYAHASNGEPYFYTFVDTIEPEDSENNVFNRNQQLDAMNDGGISIKTFGEKEQVINLTAEAKLIDGYNNLNKQGKKEAIKRIEEMAYIPKYSRQFNNEE